MGDGAINEGAFHEGINMAAIWKLPVIFVCENNLYGASTKIENMINVKEITERVKAYGIKSTSIDGMNVIEVYKTIQNFSELIHKGQGPFFVECKTYRFVGHSRSDTNKYRLKNEEDFWKKKDPIIFIEKKLLKEKIVDKEYFDKIKNLSHNELNQAVKYAERSPLPKIKDIKRNVYAL